MTERRRPQTLSSAPHELSMTEYAALRQAVGELYRIEQYEGGWNYIYDNRIEHYEGGWDYTYDKRNAYSFWFVKDPKGGYWCGYTPDASDGFYGDTPAEAVCTAMAAQRLGVVQ